MSDTVLSRRVPLSQAYSARISFSCSRYLLSANRRKIRPRTGVEYSLDFRSEFARRLSAASQRSFSSCFNCSLVIGASGTLTKLLLVGKLGRRCQTPASTQRPRKKNTRCFFGNARFLAAPGGRESQVSGQWSEVRG